MSNQENEILHEIQKQVEAVFNMLNGKDGTLGLSQKVAVMWRIHVWALCTLSGFLGSIFTYFLMKSMKMI